jgi:uncharacterized peroxidase-related enzyme
MSFEGAEAADVQPREAVIDLVSEAEATGRVDELYREIREARDGELEEDLSLSKLWLMYGNDAELLDIVWQHMDWTYNRGSLPFELKSKISLVVASVLECEGCQFFHESALSELGADAAEIDALSELEIAETGFEPAEEIVLRFSQKAATDPHAITDDDFLALRELGLSEPEILEILDCIALHVYTAFIQGMSGIVYPGMSKEAWTEPV